MSAAGRTLLTVVILTGLSRVYAAVVGPLTEPVVLEPAVTATASSGEPLPSLADEAAREHLPDQPWAARARTQMNLSSEGFAYFDKRRPIQDDRQNKIRFTPFAMVWFDPKREGDRPYTLTCQSMVVEFQRKFDLADRDSESNRIVGGRFDGEVRITGPDGLELLGRNVFMFEERDDARLYSDSPVQFAYGPAAGEREQVRGKAVAFEITFATDDESLLGQDMPRIGGISRLVLRREVALEIVLDDGDSASPISIRNDGRFVYDFETMIAEFNDDVHVARPTHRPGRTAAFDRLSCERLSLTLEPNSTAAEGKGGDQIDLAVDGSMAASGESNGMNLNLQLGVLEAYGREVVVTSEENELHARMGYLHYDVPSRTLQLIRDERAETCRIQVASSFLACPEIELTHDEDHQIRAARCLGAGEAWQADQDSDARVFEASWNEGLTLSENPDSESDLLELHGDARLVRRQEKMAVLGDVLRVWFDSERIAKAAERDWSTERISSGNRFPLHRVVAEQTTDFPVTLVSPDLLLETERLDVAFAEANVVGTVGRASQEAIPVPATAEGEQGDSPLIVTAGEVNASIGVDMSTQEVELAELIASTDVRVRGRLDGDDQPALREDAGEGPFFIKCEMLNLHHDHGGYVLRLQGEAAPARVKQAAEAVIEGNDIRLNRGQNDARVIGPGTIEVRVERGLQGRELEEHNQYMRISWAEQMHFDGQSASFFGRTKTTLANSVMKCDRMDVTLNRRISFLDDDPPSDELDIATIHCRDGVTLEYHEFGRLPRGEREVVVCFRKMRVADFSYDRSTGEFAALGPGQVWDWRRGNGRQRLQIAPQAVSRANQGATSNQRDWDYTWLEFAGELKGNEIDRYVTLRERVKVVHGPVENALQEIKRDDFSAQPEIMDQAVWLGSDQMNFRLLSAEEPEGSDWLQVVAFGHAEMEGKVFTARADEISYDESKEQFTLIGRGADAVVYYQDRPGEQWRAVPAKTIKFVPSKNRLQVEETSGGRFIPR